VPTQQPAPPKGLHIPILYAAIGLAVVGLVGLISWALIFPTSLSIPTVTRPIVIPDQQITDSVFVQSVTVNSPKGGFLVIYESDPGTSGIISNLYLTRTGYLFPGTYTDFRMRVENDVDPVVPTGNLMFGVLYEDTNGSKHWEDDGTDRMASDQGGEPIRQAFRASDQRVGQ
jgi:hypothetical protein